MSIVSDFTILIVPIPLIWDLQVPLRRKVELTTVFGLGVLYVRSPSNLMDWLAELDRSARASQVLCELTIPASGFTSMTLHTIMFEFGSGRNYSSSHYGVISDPDASQHSRSQLWSDLWLHSCRPRCCQKGSVPYVNQLRQSPLARDSKTEYERYRTRQSWLDRACCVERHKDVSDKGILGRTEGRAGHGNMIEV